MKPQFDAAQFASFETALLEGELPGVRRRLRADFPVLLEQTSEAELELFVRACYEQAATLGALDDADQVYKLSAFNLNVGRIAEDDVAFAYFGNVAASPSLTGGQKIELLHRNLSRYFANEEVEERDERA